MNDYSSPSSGKEKSYRFDVGNSDVGAVGFCARITAKSPAEAVERLNEYLSSDEFLDGLKTYDDVYDDPEERPAEGLEYLRIYFGKVTEADIDEVNDLIQPEAPEEDED